MKRFIPALLLFGASMVTTAAPPGVMTVPSAYPVAESIARLSAAAREKNLVIFATIDFSRDAADAGLPLHPSRLLIVGNPKAGTPVMQAAPLAALDLPLKILIWSDTNGKVWASYNAPAYLQDRYGLSNELARPLAGIGDLIRGALQPDQGK